MQLVSLLSEQLDPTWFDALRCDLEAPYFRAAMSAVDHERSAGVEVYPTPDNVFRALRETPLDRTKVVILGQDPYHGPGQAHGLAFSVEKGVPIPPSLRNIFKEIQADVGCPPPPHGCLCEWSKQGVLLLNATLTVRRGQAGSHQGMGWEKFTDAVVSLLWQRPEPVVFLLWGSKAQEKVRSIMSVTNQPQHRVLIAPHPSPLSAYTGFLGCRHFSAANEFLVSQGLEPIDWRLK